MHHCNAHLNTIAYVRSDAVLTTKPDGSRLDPPFFTSPPNWFWVAPRAVVAAAFVTPQAIAESAEVIFMSLLFLHGESRMM
jgi:hypothetical protein